MRFEKIFSFSSVVAADAVAKRDSVEVLKKSLFGIVSDVAGGGVDADDDCAELVADIFFPVATATVDDVHEQTRNLRVGGVTSVKKRDAILYIFERFEREQFRAPSNRQKLAKVVHRSQYVIFRWSVLFNVSQERSD